MIFSGRGFFCGAVRWRGSPDSDGHENSLKVFAGVEEVSGVEGVFDLVVEMAEGRSGGKFPPRYFG